MRSWLKDHGFKPQMEEWNEYDVDPGLTALTAAEGSLGLITCSFEP